MFKKRILGKASFMGLALLLTTVLGIVAPSASAMGELGEQPNCRQIAPVPVTLSPSNHTVYHVAGQLCGNGSLVGKTAQLLIHGFSYDHRYWDWPQAPQNSYVRSATNAGYATLAIDRIGDGDSSHPADGSQVTANASGYVIHQIVQKLHAGSIGGAHFSKVITVGHSFGSAAVAYEAGTYHDVNGVIISGYLHDISQTAIASFAAGVYPASQDPAFAHSGLNDTYVTTRPGTRAAFFFNPADVDPAIVAKDEQIKQTGTVGELDPTSFDQANAVTTNITAPVLITMGQDDVIFCNASEGLSCTNSSAILAREQSHFGPKAHLEAYVLPNSGHDINLHRNANQWFNAANNWANSHVGRS
jgi:pimeloyl-ACP methyl ester carboxylesterase